MKVFLFFRTLLLVSLLFLITSVSVAEPLITAEKMAEKGLASKVNVTTTWDADVETLGVKIDATEFNFGWFHVPVSRREYAEIAGIYGQFRVPDGERGRWWISAMILIPHSGEKSEYYVQEIGASTDSRGEWVEFYLPFSRFTPQRDTRRNRVTAELLKQTALLEISVGNLRENASLEFRGLRLVTTEEDKTLGRKVERLRLARQLKRENELVGNVHPRLLLHGERLARLRGLAERNADFAEKTDDSPDEIRAYRHFLTLAEQARREIDAENPFAKVFNYEKNASVTDHRNRGRFEGTLHPIVTQLETLAATAVITENDDYGRHAARALVNMARTLDVNSSEIEQGFYYTRTFYVRTLAFGYDWLYPWLTPEERREVKVTLLGFIQDIYERSWTDGWGRHPLHRVWNWDPGLVSCAGLGVLALQGETWTEEDAMLVQFRRHLRDYLTFGIDFDGCCHEGPAYLAYGIGSGVQFAECLREKGYGDLFTETNWQLIAPWLVSEMLPNKPMWNNLSDCSHGAPTGYPIYAYTCGRLAELAENDPVRPEDQETDFPLIQEEPLDYLQHFRESPGEKRFSYGAYAQLMQWAWRAGKEMSPDVTTFGHAGILAYLFFYQPYTSAEDPGKYLPQSLFFRGRGLVVVREHGYGKDAFHLAVEAGPHASGHDQSDKGTFTFRAYGQDFVIDSGYGNDGEKMKSGSSFAHNIVLIDGEGQPMTWHNYSHGKITGYTHHEDYDWIRTDAREAWNVTFSRLKNVSTGKNVAKADRHYVFMRNVGDGIPPYLVTFDDFQMADGEQHDFTWQLHTSADFDFDTTQKPWVIRQKQNDFQVLTSAKEERPGAAHGRAFFTLTAPKDGKFALVGVTRCGGEIRDKSDSFFVKVNDGPTLTWDLIPSGAFAFCRVSDRVTGDVILDLKAGETVRVTLWAREPEAEIAFLGLRVPEDKNMEFKGLLPISEAILDEKMPFLRKKSESPKIEAEMAIFPVSKSAESVRNAESVDVSMFETTNIGIHPRLTWTVNAVEPQFIAVLVPRPDKRMDLPTVGRVKDKDGFGVSVLWSSGKKDTIRLKPGKNGLEPEVSRN